MKQQAELLKHDILSYYYNTYIGLAVVLVLLVSIKFSIVPLWLSIVLLVGVIMQIVFGIRKLERQLACPYCGIGSQKGRWFANMYYRAMLPLEKEEYECPYCGGIIKITEE